MAKIYTDEEICYLRKNPNVRTIRHDRLSLTYEFRCHLYDAYMTSGRSGMRAALEQAGIPCKMVGLGVIRQLCGNFDKRRPVNCSGTAPSIRRRPNTPQEVDLLVSSGAFVRKNNGISFSDDFVSYVARHYPDVTVSSALKELGVDPDLVFLETIVDSTFHLLQCAEERILWSCPGKDTPDQSEASRFGQR